MPAPEDPETLEEPSNPSVEAQGDNVSPARHPDGSGGRRHSDQPRFRRWLTIRDEPRGFERHLLGLACILLVLLVWHILTRGEGDERIVNAYTLPSIGETVKSFPSLWFERALTRSAVASLSRVVGGFLLAASVAVPLGVMAGCFPRIDAFFRPLSIFGRNIPIAALIPLTLIWFGIYETQKVMFIFFAAAAFIFFDTSQSVRSVAGNYLDTAYTLGARTSWKKGFQRALLFGLAYGLLAMIGIKALAVGTAPAMAEVSPDAPPFITIRLLMIGLAGFVGGTLLWLPVQGHQAISKVLFPLALPHIVNSMRLLFGLAFGYIMLAEVINADLGLGNIIIISQRRGPREHIYLALIAIALLAFFIDRLIMWIQRRAFPHINHGH